jgi:hypothetical protein
VVITEGARRTYGGEEHGTGSRYPQKNDGLPSWVFGSGLTGSTMETDLQKLLLYLAYFIGWIIDFFLIRPWIAS